jgi:transposase-like protein
MSTMYCPICKGPLEQTNNGIKGDPKHKCLVCKRNWHIEEENEEPDWAGE